MTNKQEKYDRQLRLWADNGQAALEHANILVVRPNVTSLELLKNLILPGVGKFTLLDEHRVITQDDLANNFYLNDEDLGRDVLETLASNLTELNQEDVVGDYIGLKGGLQDYIKDQSIHFWENFNLIITDWNYDFIYQNKSVKELDIPVVALNSVSYFGYIRIYNNSFHVIETHPQAILDLRLLSPWPELLDFAASFDLESLDIENHSQVPYLIIQLKALQHWFTTRENVPKTSQEKSEFKNVIQNWKKEYNELNFDEAITNSHKVFNQTKIPSNIRDIFDRLNENFNAQELKLKTTAMSKKDEFWVLIKALSLFVETHDGFLPLSGDLPDMDSTTTNYLALKSIYKGKAQRDLDEFTIILKQLLLNINKPLDYYSEANLVKLVKNVKSLFYSENTRSPIDMTKLDSELSNEHTSIILGILTVERYILEFGSFPKVQDLEELNKIANGLFPDSGKHETFEKVLYELIRGEGHQLNNIGSILGGIGGQECLKLLTNQYIPLDNFLVFDGLKSVTERYKV